MATCNEMISRLAAFDVDAVVQDILSSNENVLSDLNKEQLFDLGVDKDGNQLDAYREIAYSKEKALLNPSHPGIPDLRYTGAFYSGWKLTLTAMEYDFTSTDSKTADLTGKYGEGIFGLTSQNKYVFRQDYLLPQLIQQIKDQTGLQ